MIKKNFKKSFTLVELIVVIAIIAILAVISFLWLNNWLGKARDASRSSNIAEIDKALQMRLAEKTALPKPDNNTMIYASGTDYVIGYQGYFGQTVRDTVGNIDKAPKDGDNYFTYYVNSDLNKYELMGYFENPISYNPNIANAEDYAENYIYVRGNKLGILTDENKNPLQDFAGSGFNILSGESNYTAYLDNSTNASGTGKQLFSYYYNQTQSLLQNTGFARYDSSLVFYSDMETTVDSGGSLVMKDLGGYGNNGICQNGTTSLSCGNAGGPQFVQGKVGKALQFNGATSSVAITSGYSILNRGSGVFTISAQMNINYINPTRGSTVVRIGIGCNTSGYAFTLDKDGIFYAYNRDGISAETKTRSNILEINDRYNIIVVSDGKSLKFYLDGKLLEIADYSQIFAPVNGMSLDIGANKGNCGAYSSFRDGLIDEVRIYNRALGDAEVKSLYNAN